MKFNDFIKIGQVKIAAKDKSLAKSLLITSENDLKFLETLEINKISARKIMSNYYDVLRSILEAISSLDGYKIYSHEAFTYFLKEKSEKFDRYRKIRNNINYYGKDVSVEEVKEHSVEIKKIIGILKKRYLENL